jgi:long-subunit fatty acid transport protein
VHQFSPQLTISASLGRFWSDIEATNSSLAGGNRRHDDGGLYGGSISYALSERTQFDASLSENVTPSGSGTLIKSDVAAVSLTHRLSDRLTGRLGASYTRATFPATISSSVTNNNYLGEIGFSYLLAERWKLDAGYRYAGARYEQSAGEPRSNIVFVSIGYNWPGASFTDWVGRRPDTQGLPGAGPVLLPAGSAVRPSVQPESTSPERSPFDPFTVP